MRSLKEGVPLKRVPLRFPQLHYGKTWLHLFVHVCSHEQSGNETAIRQGWRKCAFLVDRTTSICYVASVSERVAVRVVAVRRLVTKIIQPIELASFPAIKQYTSSIAPRTCRALLRSKQDRTVDLGAAASRTMCGRQSGGTLDAH